jgi:hypothetical protein
MAIWRYIIMTTEQQTVTKPESELQPMPSITTDELSQVDRATQALVDAIKGLAQANIQSATDLTEEAHQGIEKSVQVLRRSWRTVSDLIEDIDERVIKAAKAAWEVLTDPTKPEP